MLSVILVDQQFLILPVKLYHLPGRKKAVSAEYWLKISAAFDFCAITGLNFGAAEVYQCLQANGHSVLLDMPFECKQNDTHFSKTEEGSKTDLVDGVLA